MKELQILSERLKEQRKKKHNTQTQLAEGLGRTMRHYQRIESGTVVTSVLTLMKLADYFDVSIDYLVGESNDKVRR